MGGRIGVKTEEKRRCTRRSLCELGKLRSESNVKDIVFLILSGIHVCVLQESIGSVHAAVFS